MSPRPQGAFRDNNNWHNQQILDFQVLQKVGDTHSYRLKVPVTLKLTTHSIIANLKDKKSSLVARNFCQTSLTLPINQYKAENPIKKGGSTLRQLHVSESKRRLMVESSNGASVEWNRQLFSSIFCVWLSGLKPGTIIYVPRLLSLVERNGAAPFQQKTIAISLLEILTQFCRQKQRMENQESRCPAEIPPASVPIMALTWSFSALLLKARSIALSPVIRSIRRAMRSTPGIVSFSHALNRAKQKQVVSRAWIPVQ